MTKRTITVTFENGKTVTRRTDRDYTHAWMVVVPRHKFDLATSTYTSEIEWETVIGFALSAEGAAKNIRFHEPKHHRARHYRPTPKTLARLEERIALYRESGYSAIAEIN